MKTAKRKKKNQILTEDAISTNTTPSVELYPNQLPKVINPVLSYTASQNTGRGLFLSPEYDLVEVERVVDTESLVRQAFGKKVALMFKEGYSFVGKNPKTVKYIKARFDQIASVSQIPTSELMRNMGTSLIHKSNVFLLKVRNLKSSGGKVRRLSGSKRQVNPVAAYFPIPAESMEVDAEGNKIRQWRQRTPSGQQKEFSPDDVIHIHFDRKDGFIFGTPLLVPVLDDIRALRKIEENIELLIYQHLFPLFQFQVGTPDRPAGLTETGEREIDVLQREIQYMPSEGGIVTTDRHKITALGSEGRALRAENYLDYFKRRVIGGLGISSVDLGEGDTSTRSTAETMSRNLIDSVKDYQQVFECFFNEHIVNELLLESTFGNEVLNEENRVYLKFKEIDIDTQIKKENHLADMFNKDILIHSEARIGCGLDPLKVPSEEDRRSAKDVTAQFPEWYQTRWKLFEEPSLLIKAMDELYSVGTQAAITNSKTDILPENATIAAQEQQKQIQSMPKPKSVKTKDAFLSERFVNIQNGLKEYLSQQNKYDSSWIAQIIRASMKDTVDYMIVSQMTLFKDGYVSIDKLNVKNFTKASQLARIHFRSRAEKFINKLIDNLINLIDTSLKGDNIYVANPQTISNIFDTLKYRINFIEDVETRKAYFYGQAICLKDKKYTQLSINTPIHACNKCQNAPKTINLDILTLDDIPPFHSSCNCSLQWQIIK